MKIIIAGCGKVGKFITTYLIQEQQHDITIIDINAEKVRKLTEEHPISGLIGNCTSINILENADIKNCDMFIATTSDDEVNMLACQLSSIYDTPIKIAMLDNTEYLDNRWQDIFIFKKIAIDKIIAPKLDLIEAVQHRLQFNYLTHIINIYNIVDNKIKIFSIYCHHNNNIIGKAIEEVENNALKENLNLKIVFIVRGNLEIIPSSKEKIKRNDKVYISVSTNNINLAYTWFCDLDITENDLLQYQKPNIVITGDSALIKDIAIELKYNFAKVKVVSNTYNENISMELEQHKIDYIKDDIRNSDYKNNYLTQNNVVVVVNNKDEDTVLTSIILQEQKSGNIFCWLNYNTYEKLLIKNNINHIFNSTDCIMPKILINLRRGVIFNIISLYNKAEIIDFELSEGSKAIGISLESIEVENNVKVISILDDKDNEVIFHSNTILLSNYRVILICSRDYIAETENIFSQVVKI